MFKIKNFLPRGLFARSLIILIVPVVLVQVVTTTVFFDNHWRRVTSRLSFAVAGEIAMVVDQYSAQTIDTKQWDLRLHLNIDDHISKKEPKIKNDTSRFFNALVFKQLRKEIENQIDNSFRLDRNSYEKTIYIYVDVGNGWLSITLPERRLYSSSGYIVILWMIGVSILLLLIAILFMRNQIKPIRKLAIVAERFGKGGDVHAFKPTGAREIRRASQSFIGMRDRIKRQMEQRTSMLAGVSHDLRTPLTRIKLQLEMMKQSNDVKAMQGDVNDMQCMINGYLEFAKGADGEQSSFSNLNDLIEKSAAYVDINKVKIHVQAPEIIYGMIKPLAMQRCLQNLFSNASRYASDVNVMLEKSDDKITIIMEDNGPGIPADQRDEVFKPFYRADTARNLKEGHVGLGLSIAQDIIHAHGGEIDLGDSDQGGLKVLITLPS